MVGYFSHKRLVEKQMVTVCFTEATTQEGLKGDALKFLVDKPSYTSPSSVYIPLSDDNSCQIAVSVYLC